MVSGGYLESIVAGGAIVVIDLKKQNMSGGYLESAAQKAKNNNGQLVIKNADELSGGYLESISKKGGNNVVIEF